MALPAAHGLPVRGVAARRLRARRPRAGRGDEPGSGAARSRWCSLGDTALLGPPPRRGSSTPCRAATTWPRWSAGSTGCSPTSTGTRATCSTLARIWSTVATDEIRTQGRRRGLGAPPPPRGAPRCARPRAGRLSRRGGGALGRSSSTAFGRDADHVVAEIRRLAGDAAVRRPERGRAEDRPRALPSSAHPAGRGEATSFDAHGSRFCDGDEKETQGCIPHRADELNRVDPARRSSSRAPTREAVDRRT